MSEGKDVQGPVRDRNGDVVGKVLGPIEADEPVDADIFLMSSPGTKGGMTGEVLTGEAVEAIEDGEAGTAEVSAHGTDAHGGDEEVLEGRVIDLSFSVVVEGERLGGEGLSATGAPETGNLAEAEGVVKADMDEPGEV
jgi:hypothetical protein